MVDIVLSGILELVGISAPFPKTEGTQLNTRLKEIIRGKGAVQLLGPSDAEITQWLSLAQTTSVVPSDVALKNLCVKIDNTLRGRSYCVGHGLTVADAALFYAIAHSQHYNASVLSECGEVSRWMDHISSVCSGKAFSPGAMAPTVFPLQSAKSKAPAAAPAAKEAAAPAAKEAAKEIDAGAPMGDAEAGKKKKKEKAAPALAAPAPVVELDPSKLDIRVGVVTKCWVHPESEKLYCEEIDVGEESVRSIASGLRAFYASAADIEGRKVLVLANLKERPLAGFKSQGMVLCASNDDHTVVQLVDAPAGSKPGDRVTFKGFDGEAATPAQVAKKKIFEKLAPELRTDENGVAHWGAVPFTVGGELCRASVPNAHVS